MIRNMLFVLTASCLVASTVEAGNKCKNIRAKIDTTLLAPESCTDSPVALCTQGKITHSWLLRGTTSFNALDLSPSAGLTTFTPPVEPASTLSYGGELVITTRFGTLTISDVGVFDTALGIFSEVDRITSGTGIFEGSTGNLFIFGDVKEDGSGFTGDIRGEICFQK